VALQHYQDTLALAPHHAQVNRLQRGSSSSSNDGLIISWCCQSSSLGAAWLLQAQTMLWCWFAGLFWWDLFSSASLKCL
jgi:hypothetical protein